MTRNFCILLFLMMTIFTACIDRYSSSDLADDLAKEILDDDAPEGSFSGILPCADCEGI